MRVTSDYVDFKIDLDFVHTRLEITGDANVKLFGSA